MRYNHINKEISNSKWQWWDYVLTGATGGLYAAGKGISDAVNTAINEEKGEPTDADEQAKAHKEHSDNDENAREKIRKAHPEYTEEQIDAIMDDYYHEGSKNPDNTYEQSLEAAIQAQEEKDKQAQAEAAQEAAETAKQTELTAGELAETEAQQNATTSAIQAQNAGLNKERAGMMGEANLANRSNANNALAGIAASTQADYLNKIGQANALQQQADNMQKGAALNTAGATVSGAAQGLANGASMFGTSDENEKCSPDLDFIKNYYSQKKDMTPQILEQAQKMFELKAQLDKLKENK